MARKSSIVGLVELDRKLRKIPDAVAAEMREAMEMSAGEVVRLAKSLVPKQSHDLERSIGWTWGAPPRGSITIGKIARSTFGKQFTITIFAGNDEAYYARFVEWGTQSAAAHPFFFVSWRAVRKDAKKIIRKAIRSGAKKVAAR